MVPKQHSAFREAQTKGEYAGWLGKPRGCGSSAKEVELYPEGYWGPGEPGGEVSRCVFQKGSSGQKGG